MTQYQNIQLATDLRTAVTRLVKKLRKKSVTGQHLSLTERSVLAQLQHGSLLPSELASAEKITNQSMSQILSHLLSLDYISRKISETDKRKVLISITGKGEKTIKQVRHERDEWLARAINENCTDAEELLLKQAMVILTKVVNFE